MSDYMTTTPALFVKIEEKEYFSKSGLEHRKIKVHEVYEFNLCEKVSFL